MGFGTTLVPVLLLFGFDPLDLVPAVLASEFVTGFVSAILHHTFGNVSFHHGSADRKAAALLAICGVFGATAAVELATHVSRRWAATYIGVMVLGTGLVILATHRMHLRLSWKGIGAVGLVAAFNKGIGGGGYGPLLTGGQILSGVAPKAAIGVTSLAEGFVSLVGVLAYFFATGHIDWKLGLALMIGALASAPLSAWTVKRLRIPHLRGLVGMAACLLGVLVLLRLVVP